MVHSVRTVVATEASLPPKLGAGILARVFLWLSLVVVALVVVGLATAVVLALAHQVGPAGGGG